MPRKSKAKRDPPSSGILSGVFSFVSREFDSFVASATGASAGPSKSGVLSDEYSDEYDSEDLEEPQDSRYQEQSPPHKRSRTNHPRRRRSASPDLHSKHPQPHKSGSHKRKERHVEEYSEEEQQSDGSRRSPSPMPLARILKRRPSMTMPGSLFPRSPSMEPESRAFAADREQRVRFSSSRAAPSASASHLHQSFTAHSDHSSGSTPSPARNPTQVTPPRRPHHLASGVKSVVDKFHIGEDDADPSILLPSPKKSPHAMGKTQYLQTRHSEPDISPPISSLNKGKARAIDPDASGMLRVRGKEKELVAAREEFDRHQRRLDHDEDEQSFTLEQVERSRDKDRERIRMLEEEIERLKSELSKRPTAMFTDTRSYPPPPPPPPPPPLPKKTIIDVPTTSSDPNLFASARASLKQAPTPVENPIVPARRPGIATVGLAPDKMAAFLNEMKTVRLRKTSQRPGGSAANATFTAPTPPSRIAQLPLRRSFSLQRPPISLSSRSEPVISLNPLLESVVRIGEKRKRTATNEPEETQGSSKRHSSVTSAHQSFESISTSSTSQSLPPTESSTSLSLPRTYPATSKTAIPTKPWQTSSVTDAPTPSLCSDNEVEREDDASPDDQPPTTPPIGPSRSFYRFKGNGIPIESDASDREKEKRRAVKDVVMGNVSRREKRTPFIREKEPRANIFDKRVPVSPFPNKSPRRPRIPSRTLRHPAPPTPPRPRPRDADHSDDDDPLSLSFSSPETPYIKPPQLQEPAQPPRAASRASSRASSHALPPRHPEKSPTPQSIRSSRSRRGSGRAQQAGRRLTLDEELRNAVPFLHEDEEEDEHEHGHGHEGEEDYMQDADADAYRPNFDEDDDQDRESGVLIGVGTRSKRRGFLAHGGAGGAPVFMGVGYVEGAEEEESDDAVAVRGGDLSNDEYLPSPPTRKSQTHRRR